MTARHVPADEPFFREWHRRVQGSRRSRARAATLASLVGALPCPVPVVTVVGSKGKGSAAAACASLLHASGRRVGLVTSPAYRHNKERVRIDGCAITEPEYAALAGRLADALDALPPAVEGHLAPTGLFTIMGVSAVLARGADVIVLEEGLGGATDEVSLFAPSVVVATPIFREHAGTLGDTVAEIAANLLGVVGPQTHTIVTTAQSPEVRHVVMTKAAAGVVVVECARDASESLVAHNVTLGLTAAMCLGGAGDAAFTRDRLRLPGRMTVLRPALGSTWLVDSAIDGVGFAAALADFDADVVIVCLPDDKDIPGALAAVGTRRARYVTAGVDYLSFTASRWPGPLEPWDTVVRSELGRAQRVACLGTISFVGELLEHFDVPTDCVF